MGQIYLVSQNVFIGLHVTTALRRSRCLYDCRGLGEGDGLLSRCRRLQNETAVAFICEEPMIDS